MAFSAPTCRSARALWRTTTVQWPLNARHAATATATAGHESPDFRDLAPTPFIDGEGDAFEPFDPLALSRRRTTPLPRSRYQMRPPKYYRGPLHPHQPPPPSDPASREFVPGPFTAPRLEQTYHSTIASDLMVLSYKHYPPGEKPAQKLNRLRKWEGDNPYFKNRPLRGPRGSDTLGLIRKRVTFRNVPKLEGIVVHSFVREALEDDAALHVAGMALQSMTGVRVRRHRAKRNEVAWGLRDGHRIAVTATLRGEDMYHFLSKLVDVVLPRIRDWQGIKGTSGDDNGNISLGITRDVVAMFPEIEVNYDAYPPKLIPGCHITIQTSATSDKDARLLLTAFGFPVFGKRVD